MGRLQKGKRRLVSIILIWTTAIILVMGASIVIAAVWFQDSIVQQVIEGFNADFKGAIVISETQINPITDFPYVSVNISNVQVYEDKEDMFAPILDVANISLGVNFWSLLSGAYVVNLLKVENGNFDIYRYTDGSFNLINALSGEMDLEELKQEYHIELEKVELSNLDIIKYDEETKIHAETYIEQATSKFKSTSGNLQIGLNSQLVLNVIHEGDSTVFRKKHIEAKTELLYDKENGLLTVEPSDMKIQNGMFSLEGEIKVLDDFDMDLEIHGNNANFDLLIAFAPEELIPTLEQYDNAGNIYFDAYINGKSLRGKYPQIEARFGCDSAYFRNPLSNKKLEEISFSGHFTNGSQRDLSTMEFTLENVSAKPEAGTFKADLHVHNFESPEIDMQIESDFDLDFLAKFLNVKRLRDLGGAVSLKMNFHDIVDLQNPEKSLEDFSQSYFTELNVEDLTFKLPDYPVAFDSIDIKATMDGNRASIEYIYMNIGSSDLSIRGEVDDFPAVVHQSKDSVNAELFLYSSLLDIKELTTTDSTSKGFDERIENMRLELSFLTTPYDLMNSPNLPVGDFHLRNFYGKLKHYPHTLKKINAHIIVEDEKLNFKELNGRIDKSNVTYSGILYDYPILLQDSIKGSVEMDFSMKSDVIRLHDLFTYRGENYVPPDYREEEIHNAEIFGNAEVGFNNGFDKVKVYFDQLNAQFIQHDMNIKDIHGKFSYADEFLQFDNVNGSVGNTSFSADVVLYQGKNDSIRKANNKVWIYADVLDYDELSNYETRLAENKTVDHDSVFNIYELPFTDLNFALDIEKMKYHKILIEGLNSNLRIQKNHHLYIDTLRFTTSGGQFDIRGYFDGSNPDSIFFYPNIDIQHVNLETALFTFDNFGQDYIISENLVGNFSGNIHGEIKVHPDLVPQIDHSNLSMEIEIVNGVLRDYKPLKSLSEFFKNKNLSYIRFDTLSNELELTDGRLNIPTMTINSSLGYMDISGMQDTDYNMEYYFKVPLKLVSKAAWSKLFGKKKQITDSANIDAIQYKDESKKRWYVNIKLEGNPDEYTVSLGKKKKSKS